MKSGEIMSAFKRYQSKVFWDQMASRDLEDNRFAVGNEPPRYDASEFSLREESLREDSTSSKSGDDTMDNGNITAIRIYNSPNEDSKQKASQILLTRHKSVTHSRMEEEQIDSKEEREITFRNRSCSPLSQDLKSQDSGFSDSEKSDCSESYENMTPKRRLRRNKRTKQRCRSSSEIASPWSVEESPPNPMHASTPKDPRIFQNARDRFGKPVQRRRTDQVQDNALKISSSSVSLEDECLGDFLYAAEPPEDSVQPTTTKLSFSTDSSENAVAAGKDVLNSRNYRQSSSMRVWLTDLAIETENECGSALQNKSLPRRRAPIISEEAQTRDLKMLSSMATVAASKLLNSVEQFEQHYRNIVEKITRLEGKSEMGLLRNIEEAAYAILSQLGAPPPRRIQRGNLKSILAQLQDIRTYVNDTIDMRLDFYIEKIVRGLEEAPRENSDMTRGALAALTALGLSDPRAGSSIARCSGIKALLTCLIGAGRRNSSDDLVAVSLRALASICCSSTAIEYFARNYGPEILTDLLTAESACEREKMEATALVVQITAPWTNARGLPHLEPFASSLIPALNQLIENTSCAQTMLLAAAAINHMSKSRLCADIILEEDSVKKLLRSVKKSATGGNVWLMEQVAALIGELARTSVGRLHLANARASVALVSFLRMRPPGLEDAYRRLEITATAALTRLCVEPEIARQVVAVGGGNCLPTCTIEDAQIENKPDIETNLLKYTRSLRHACRKATKQINIAKAKDHSTFD